MSNEPLDLSPVIASIQAQFKLKGLNWQSPSVRQWMNKVSVQLGHPVNDQYDLPEKALVSLAKKLEERTAPTPVNQLKLHAEDRGIVGDHRLAAYVVKSAKNQVKISIDLFGVSASDAHEWVAQALVMLDDSLTAQDLKAQMQGVRYDQAA